MPPELSDLGPLTYLHHRYWPPLPPRSRSLLPRVLLQLSSTWLKVGSFLSSQDLLSKPSKGLCVMCQASGITVDRVPDMGKRQVMNFLLMGVISLPTTRMLVPYTALFILPSFISRVRKTVLGSAEDIGWSQRAMGMPPVKDGTERFMELLHNISFYEVDPQFDKQ